MGLPQDFFDTKTFRSQYFVGVEPFTFREQRKRGKREGSVKIAHLGPVFRWRRVVSISEAPARCPHWRVWSILSARCLPPRPLPRYGGVGNPNKLESGELLDLILV